MDLPPPSDLALSIPAPVVGASDGISSPAEWDWGNFLDFSIEADDSLILDWDAPDLSHPPSPRPPLSKRASPAEPVPADLPVSGSSGRVRKRDPRLVCANYLAGRVPCACPEADEKELEEEEEEEPMIGGRKRARSGVVSVRLRCQVWGCEADIRELKGYHRRHRVCLQCANASSVFLDGEEKRYCQQCGKFHVLLDFDEGKRSCRRKLERHNRRRRRKPTDSNREVEIEKLSQGDPSEDIFLDTSIEVREETLKGSACQAVDDGARNKVIDGKMCLTSENVNGYPGCSFTGLEQAQTNSPLSTASADALIDDRTNNQKSSFSSTICDKRTSYLSVCPTGRISFKLYDWNPAEFPRRLRHQIFQWLASMPVELEGYIRPGCTIFTIFIAMPQHMWEKLSQDGVLYIKQLINLPESFFMGRGNIFVYLNNMRVHVLEDGTSLVKMEVEAPSLHFVHPRCFEAGKKVEFIACGTNLDQPKLRFLVSFAGKYLVCDFCRIVTHQKVRCDGGNSVVSSKNCEHEMFRINIKNSHPGIFGPAFIEVENESGISNFIPILIGDKQICSELENLQGALNQYTNAQEDNSVSCAIFAKTAFSKVNVTRQIDLTDLLLDIAWLLKEPCKECYKPFFGALNVQRLKYMLLFSLQNELISVLNAILKYVSIMIHDVDLQNSVNLTLRADLVQLLQYMETAREYLNQRTQHMETSKLDSEHSCFTEIFSVNHVKNAVVILTRTNPVNERSNEHGLGSTSPLLSVDRDKSPSHAPKDITRGWLAIFTMCTSVMCLLVCVILFNPNRANEL